MTNCILYVELLILGILLIPSNCQLLRRATLDRSETNKEGTVDVIEDIGLLPETKSSNNPEEAASARVSGSEDDDDDDDEEETLRTKSEEQSGIEYDVDDPRDYTAHDPSELLRTHKKQDDDVTNGELNEETSLGDSEEDESATKINDDIKNQLISEDEEQQAEETTHKNDDDEQE